MRRLLAGAATGLALLLAAPVAGAQDGGSWAGSRETTPSRTESTTFDITARFIRSYNANLPGVGITAETWLTTPAGLPAGCGAAGEELLPRTLTRPGDEVDATDTYLDELASVSCNGTYTFRVRARLRRGVLTPQDHEVSGSIGVAAPPPEVGRVTAAIDGSSVDVSWAPASSLPPDFLGYRVERRAAGGSWEPIASRLDPGKKTFTDTSPPLDQAEVSYRVRSRRNGPDGDEVRSDGRTATVKGSGTSVPGTDGDTTVPGTDGDTTVPGTDGDTTVPGTDGGAGDGDGDGNGSRGGAGVPRSGPQARGRTGIGTRAPRLGTPSQANFPPLLTPDSGGFDEEIDYGDRPLAGEEEGEDELSSLFYEEDTGRGMAVPVATGFVLAAWAFHFRFLAKAARPVPVAAGPAHGRRRSGAGEPDPFYEPVEPDPFEDAFGPAQPVAPRPSGPPVRYEAPAHYRPPTLADRYDPFSR